MSRADRQRFSLDGAPAYNGPGALEESAPVASAPVASASHASWSDAKRQWSNGNLQLIMDGQEILAQRADGTKFARMGLTFSAQGDGERVANYTSLSVLSLGDAASYYGFGEHGNGKLDLAFTEYDMESCTKYADSMGGEICLPWIMVADDYGSGRHLSFGMLQEAENATA